MGIFTVNAVVNGAVLKCSKGSTVSTLRSATGLVSVGGAMVATIADHSAANIGTFGLCASTCSPCAPVCVTPWVGGGTSVFSGPPLLSSAAKLSCSRQGSISIVDPGQHVLTLGQATEGEELAEVLLLQGMTPEQVRVAIAKRLRELHDAGLFPVNTANYSTLMAIGTVMAHKELINKLAKIYGIPPALLAGVVASEMEFDHALHDMVLDGVARNLGLSPFAGPGIASVHAATLYKAVSYIRDHHLPGYNEALARVSVQHRRPATSADLPNSIEEAAIATSMYNHAHGGSRTFKDMAVVWAGYRSGVEGVSPSGHGYTLDSFKRNVVKNPEDLQEHMKIGKNAYMSEPLFAYFQQQFS